MITIRCIVWWRAAAHCHRTLIFCCPAKFQRAMHNETDELYLQLYELDGQKYVEPLLRQ